MASMQESTDVNLMESPPDKVVLVGDVGVGKTTMFMRFKTGEFVEGTAHNPREGEYHKTWTAGGREISMTMYDTAGIERHMSTIPQTYFRWSKVIMLVYSLDDSDTFDSLTNWTDNALSARAARSQSDIVVVLVGNKLDLDDERKVSKTRALQFAENNDISVEMVFEISAKDGTGFSDMIDHIAMHINPGDDSGRGVKLHSRSKSGKKGNCC